MSSSDERVEALAKVLRPHLGECGRFGLPCAEVKPRDEWCGRCDLVDHTARALLDSPAMRDLLAEAWSKGWDEGAFGSDDRDVNPYRAEVDR